MRNGGSRGVSGPRPERADAPSTTAFTDNIGATSQRRLGPIRVGGAVTLARGGPRTDRKSGRAKSHRSPQRRHKPTTGYVDRDELHPQRSGNIAFPQGLVAGEVPVQAPTLRRLARRRGSEPTIWDRKVWPRPTPPPLIREGPRSGRGWFSVTLLEAKGGTMCVCGDFGGSGKKCGGGGGTNTS